MTPSRHNSGSDGSAGSPVADSGELAQQIRLKAMDLLAMREHSQKELHQKLLRRFGEEGAEAIDPVLNRLVEQGLLSDERFAEAYINMRARKGYGPVRIAQELQDKGLGVDLVEKLLAQRDDWGWLLEQAWQKKFGQAPASYEDKVRQMRFLQYRGFSAEAIRELLV